MNKASKILSALVLFFVSVLYISMTYTFQQPAEPWEVSSKFKSMENPTKPDAQSLKMGRALYTKECSSCHGKTGKGDGVKARGLETFPGDFTEESFQGQTDGEIFYKSKIGRGEMPKFDKKIPDEDIWIMVNYMRTLKK